MQFSVLFDYMVVAFLRWAKDMLGNVDNKASQRSEGVRDFRCPFAVAIENTKQIW